MRAADAIVRALEKEGVEYIAGFQGGGLNPLWTGLRNSETIKVLPLGMKDWAWRSPTVTPALPARLAWR